MTATGTVVLVVEDDPALRDLLARGLDDEGLVPRLAATGADALREGATDDVAAVILDIGLPDADGRDVCHALRSRGLQAPVIFLTARDALVDRLAGFAAGAIVSDNSIDAYIARVRRKLRALPDPPEVATVVGVGYRLG